MDSQQTVRRPVSLDGIGLHSGETAKMTVSPATADTGILFRAADGTLIPANADHVVDSNSATTVGAFGVRVRTIEHLMAAAAALGIDNLMVDIDGPEVPAADGSAKPFVDLLRSAGRVSLAGPRRPITIAQPIRVGTESRWIEVLPADSLRISYTLDNSHPIIGLQAGTFGINEEVFCDELAAARTYGFLRDVPAMRQNGLARGGSLENAIVVGKRSVLNDSLRFPDEFVRHKILDLVGDLFLLGRPLRAHVVGRNAGHALNYQVVAAIQKALAADRRRTAARAARPVPAPVAATGDGFLPGVAAL
ncbi:MAG TPA: UDP-3-O-acyl-N-acetylglucosamine deacetylase [Methylomirabilota bacterium]|jgi:UDP-3-O-acyl N-acetylglucosamine deacetylase